MIVEWNDGTMLDLSKLNSHEEYHEWLEKNCRSCRGINYPKRVYVTDESLRWAYDNLFAVLMRDTKDYFYIRDYLKTDADLEMYSDWLDVQGLVEATSWKASKAVGSYHDWDDFVEQEMKTAIDMIKCEVSEDVFNMIDKCYEFDYGKFERNLDLEYGIGEYGTVYTR